VEKQHADKKTGDSQYLKNNRGKTQVGKQMASAEKRRLYAVGYQNI
jgi:hypothetical protein